jgi:hypothetical protein
MTWIGHGLSVTGTVGEFYQARVRTCQKMARDWHSLSAIRAEGEFGRVWVQFLNGGQRKWQGKMK